MISGSDDLVAVTVTAVDSDQGTVVLFCSESPGGTVTFAADHLTAAAILEALRAGETPTVDVPYWAVLGCPEWCGYEDVHDQERIARVAAEGRDDAPIVTCEGYRPTRPAAGESTGGNNG